MSKFFQFYPEVFDEPAIKALPSVKKYITALMLSDARNFYYAGLNSSNKPFLLKKSVRAMMEDYGASHHKYITFAREYLVEHGLLKVMKDGSKREKGDKGNKWELLAIITRNGVHKDAEHSYAKKRNTATHKLNKNIQSTSPSASDVDLKKEIITWNTKGF